MAKAAEEFVVELDADSELAGVLAAAGRKPVRLILNDQHYVVTHDPFNSVDHSDPEKFRETLRAAAGTFALEGERLKQNIYRWREEGSRPMNMITASRTADDEVWSKPGALPGVAEPPTSDEETDSSR
jgi:hypothetical protein